MMTLGVNFRDEADNIVERVDITGDLLVPGRHLRNRISCWKSLMLLGVRILEVRYGPLEISFSVTVMSIEAGLNFFVITLNPDSTCGTTWFPNTYVTKQGNKFPFILNFGKHGCAFLPLNNFPLFSCLSLSFFLIPIA